MAPGPARARAAAFVTSIVVALACSAASPAGASSAGSAAARPRWQVVYRHAGVNFYAASSSISASGPDDAWAIGNVWDRKGIPRGWLVHWDGTGWRSVAYPDQKGYVPSAVFALSPTDMWLFGSDSAQPTAAILHWSNGSWSPFMPLPLNAQNVYVHGDNDIWLEGGSLPGCYNVSPDIQGCSVTSHWNGHKWTSYPLRAVNIDSFSGSSGANVWAVGDSWEQEKSLGPGHGFVTSFRPAVYRWTGTAWRQTSPVLPRTYWAPSVVVRSAHDVFVADTTRAHPRACGIRWDGADWSPFSLPGAQRSPCYWAISDQRRGLWFYGARDSPGMFWTHWTGKRFIDTPAYFPSKNGWDTNGFVIAAVPHSSLVWLLGSYSGLTRTSKIVGVIAALR